MPQPRTADAGIGNSSRPDSAAYKAKVKLKHGSCVMLNLVFFSFVVPPLLLTPFPITQTQLRNKAGKDLARAIHCHQLTLHPSSDLSGTQL